MWFSLNDFVIMSVAILPRPNYEQRSEMKSMRRVEVEHGIIARSPASAEAVL